MTVRSGQPIVVINHPSAQIYSGFLRQQFPDLPIIEAPDQKILGHHIEEAEIILAFQFPVSLFDRAKELRWFQCTGAGVDSLFPIRDRLGKLIVTNASGIHGELIADYVMAGLTMLHWNFAGFLKDQVGKRWMPRPITPLSEKTVGVLGLGSVGAAIASRAKAAGMMVLGSKRDISASIDGVDALFTPDGIRDMLPRCDFVVLALPATRDTVGFIDAKALESIRSDAFLINIARGSIVVEADLVKALESGSIAGAMLDVFAREPLPPASPLWTMPNVIVTPHVAGNPTDYERRAYGVFAENLKRYLEGSELKNVVDLARGY